MDTEMKTTSPQDKEDIDVDMDFLFLLMEQRQISAPTPVWPEYNRTGH